MKTCITILCMTFTSLVLACPNFTGTWSCQDNVGDTYTTVVDQEVRDGVVVYYHDDGSGMMEVITDNQWHEMEAEGMVDVVYRASCSGQSVDFIMEGTIPSQGDFPGGAINSVTDLHLDDRGRMVSTTLTYYNGDLMASTYEVCTKN